MDKNSSRGGQNSNQKPASMVSQGQIGAAALNQSLESQDKQYEQYSSQGSQQKSKASNKYKSSNNSGTGQ